MTKSELIREAAKRAELPQSTVTAVLDAALDTIADTLQAGEAVRIPGFGTFEVRTRAARDGRNPSTGETMHIPEARVPAFKAGRTLREAVRGQNT